MASEEDRQSTERVVLKYHEAVEGREPTEKFIPSWIEVGTFHGSKKQAIEAYAGKDGKDHPGTYRAPAVRSWKGEVTFEADPEPRMKTTWSD